MERPSPSPQLRRALMSGAALLPAGANVVMQLSQLPVGHAVATSPVVSGSLVHHPIKRTRTTLAFLVIAVFGTDEERRALRHQINRSHAPVRSGPDDTVTFSAFDPELQGWVAACLYQGARQALALNGPVSDELADELYRVAERLGTTLQVPPGWWPAERAAFESYWSANLARARFDEVTRAYLHSFVDLDFLPWHMGLAARHLNRLIVGEFLPASLRDSLHLAWSPTRERAARALVYVLSRVWRRLPGPLRRLPLNVVLWDTRRRLAAGRSVV